MNTLKGTVKVVAIKAPGFGDNKKATLRDIAIVTGATVIREELGLKLESVQLEQLGACEKVTVSKDETVIVGGAGKKETVEGRADEIRRQLETTDSNYEKEKLKERRAKLTGGVAVIDVEVNETKDLYEDSLNATRAAIEDGLCLPRSISLGCYYLKKCTTS